MKERKRETGKQGKGDPREGSAGGGGRTIIADRRCRCVLLLAPPPSSRKLLLLLAVSVDIAKWDDLRPATIVAFPSRVCRRRVVEREVVGSHRVRERESTGEEERKERPAPATAGSAARNPAVVARVRTTGKDFKFGFYSFGFREPLSSLHVYFSYLPPLLVVLNCCTVVAAVRVTGNMAMITGTTIGVTVISVQPIELRVLIAKFYGCCIQHQGAASSPELLLLCFLDYSIELRLRCREGRY
ncbi:uncharacterized protein DS421_13g419500 [Arachis hypogaea]|nr:uncharacterized protein DS421_13g419500 [Arachis hypogaea]